MYSSTTPDRDPFEFSLRGIRAANSHAFVPAVADVGIDRMRNEPAGRPSDPAPGHPRSAVVREVEAVLARYFAHGVCTAA
jgi:hypothetical protein